MQTWNMINMMTMETTELNVDLATVREIVSTLNKANPTMLWAAVEAD